MNRGGGKSVNPRLSKLSVLRSIWLQIHLLLQLLCRILRRPATRLVPLMPKEMLKRVYASEMPFSEYIRGRLTGHLIHQYSQNSLLSSTVDVQLAFTHRDCLVADLGQVGLLRHPTVVDCVNWKPFSSC